MSDEVEKGEILSESESEKEGTRSFAERMRQRAQEVGERARTAGRSGIEGSAAALKQASAFTADVATTAKDKAGILSRASAEAAGAASSKAWEQVSTFGKSARDRVLSAPGKVAELFVRECSVPAFLLPTGSGAGDFRCVFQFEEAVDKLSHGLLVRPQIEVWAGREDIDRGKLAAVLKDDFTRQLSAERARAREQNSRQFSGEIDRLKEEQETAGTDLGAASTGLVASLLFMFFVANPIFDLLFLVLAVFSGTDGVMKVGSYLKAATRIRRGENAATAKVKELEAEFDAKNESFGQAIQNLDVHIHPLLRDLVADFCELDDRPNFPSEAPLPDEAPPVNTYLNLPEYRQALESWYHPLVDGRLH